MERNRDIRLNPELPAADIKEGGGGNRIPLSDRYGIPVFAVETSRKEWELHLEESRRLERIRQEGGRKTLGHPPPDFPDRIGRTDAGILGSGRFTVSSRVRIGIGDNGASFPGYSERNHEFLFWQTKNQG